MAKECLRWNDCYSGAMGLKKNKKRNLHVISYACFELRLIVYFQCTSLQRHVLKMLITSALSVFLSSFVKFCLTLLAKSKSCGLKWFLHESRFQWRGVPKLCMIPQYFPFA